MSSPEDWRWWDTAQDSMTSKGLDMDTPETLIARLEAAIKFVDEWLPKGDWAVPIRCREEYPHERADALRTLRDAAHALSGATPAKPVILLERAVADRDKRPWRYYRLEYDDLKRMADQLRDKIDSLEALTPVSPTAPEQEKADFERIVQFALEQGDDETEDAAIRLRIGVDGTLERLKLKREASVSTASEGWQPIATAPKDGTWMWAVFGRQNPRVTTLRFDLAFNEWMSGTGWWGDTGPFTHWCPLNAVAPAPPASAGAEEP